MKKIILIFALINLTVISKAQSFEDVPEGKSIMIIPSQNQIRIGDGISVNKSAGVINVVQKNSLEYTNPNITSSDILKAGPKPGLNTVPGTLTQVKVFGDNTYFITCVNSSNVCILYFIKI